MSGWRIWNATYGMHGAMGASMIRAFAIPGHFHATVAVGTTLARLQPFLYSGAMGLAVFESAASDPTSGPARQPFGAHHLN